MPKIVKSKGFTLIELLVVISIIAILSAIGLVNYQQVAKKGRDSRRQADLRTIQAAMEQYHTDNHYYAPSIILTGGAELNNCSGVTGCSSPTKIYLKSTPTDPTNSGTYTYLYTASGAGCGAATPTLCTDYCAYAQLEADTSTSLSGCPASGSYNFAVTRP